MQIELWHKKGTPLGTVRFRKMVDFMLDIEVTYHGLVIIMV